MSLGERIKEQRKSSGLSQEKVAELVGVSRQAVTKWETGQSAPSTENLFKLAEIFGTTVDLLLDAGERENTSPAEEVYYLYKMEEAKRAEELRERRKRNLLLALAVVGGYLAVYLLGRIFGTAGGQYTVMGWLLGTDPQQLSYLYGWLLHNNLFWMAMAVSAVPALFGRYRFSFATLSAFGLGLLLGELLGENPAGAPYGHGHYGWAIWGGVFLFSAAMGIVLERLSRGGLTLSSRKLWVWGGAFVAGVTAVVLFVRLSMPQTFGG